MFTASWCPKPTLRTVVQQRSRDILFTHPFKDGTSYLTMPKASEVTRDGKKFTICFADIQDALTYEFTT